MRGLDATERAALEGLLDHRMSNYYPDEWAPISAWLSLEQRGLIVTSCQCPWTACKCDNPESIRVSPIGLRILELDRLAREGAA